MNRISIVWNDNKKSEVSDIAMMICDWLVDNAPDIQFGCFGSTAKDDDVLDADALIILGGDGTVAGWARRIAASKYDPLVMSINFGTCGFVTEIQPEKIADALDKLIKNQYNISERDMLIASFMDEERRRIDFYAMNEVTVKVHSIIPRMARLNLQFNDENYVFYHEADGLIFTTTTGSTAYSLSAGGSILHPSLNVIGVTPLCSHGLNSRPLVVPDTTKFKVWNKQKNNRLQVVVDGQEFSAVDENAFIHIRKTSKPLKMIYIDGDSFYMKLQKRLEWGKGIQ